MALDSAEVSYLVSAELLGNLEGSLRCRLMRGLLKPRPRVRTLYQSCDGHRVLILWLVSQKLLGIHSPCYMMHAPMVVSILSWATGIPKSPFRFNHLVIHPPKVLGR